MEQRQNVCESPVTTWVLITSPGFQQKRVDIAEHSRYIGLERHSALYVGAISKRGQCLLPFLQCSPGEELFRVDGLKNFLHLDVVQETQGGREADDGRSDVDRVRGAAANRAARRERQHGLSTKWLGPEELHDPL